MRSGTQNKTLLSVREMTVFAMLGALMFVSKLIMEYLRLFAGRIRGV